VIKAVFVDMDNTLIVNEVLYDYARHELAGYLCCFGIDPKESFAIEKKTDVENYKTHGYSRTRFPLSFEMTLKHFIPKADEEMIKEVRAMAETVFTTIAPLKPGAKEAIEDLTARFDVYIVTQGDRSVQEFRLSHLPFKDKLAGDFIVDKKSTETFAGLAKELNLGPGEAIMVGDSIKSDVIPAIQAGFLAAWIEEHNWTAIEKSEFPAERAYKFSSLSEFARHLSDAGEIELPKPHRQRPAPKPPQP